MRFLAAQCRLRSRTQAELPCVRADGDRHAHVSMFPTSWAENELHLTARHPFVLARDAHVPGHELLGNNTDRSAFCWRKAIGCCWMDSTHDLTIKKAFLTFLLGRASGSFRSACLACFRSAVVGPGYGVAGCPCRCRKKGEEALVLFLPPHYAYALYYPDAIYLPNSRSPVTPPP